MASHTIHFPDKSVADFCKRHHIRKLSLFGSALRGELRADSDIDLLVEFETGHVPGFLGMARLSRELSDLLGGRPVDLRTADELSRYFRDQVLSQAEIKYAA